jgi:hypothetical protein
MSSDEATPQATPGFPRINLPLGGVVFGALWIIGAFASLFYCFGTNYMKKASVPADELAIANAALAPAAEHAAEAHPATTPAP